MTADPSQELVEELLGELQRWRAERFAENGLPPGYLVKDSMLRHIAALVPTNAEELADYVWDRGRIVEKHGSEIMTIVGRFRTMHDIPELDVAPKRVDVPADAALSGYITWRMVPPFARSDLDTSYRLAAGSVWPTGETFTATCSVEGCPGPPATTDDHRWPGCGVHATERLVDCNRATYSGALEGSGLFNLVVGEVSLWGKTITTRERSAVDGLPTARYLAQHARPVKVFSPNTVITTRREETRSRSDSALTQIARDYGASVEDNPAPNYESPSSQRSWEDM